MPVLPDDTLMTPDGRLLHSRDWDVRDASLVVLVVHGLGEHSGWYAEFGEWLQQRGIASFAYDQHGHGKSPGRRGDAPTMQTLVDDIGVAVQSVENRWPDAEVVLLGHSMGGHLALRYLLQTAGSKIRRVIVTDPMILPNNPPTKPQAFAAWLTSKVIPRVRVSADLDPTDLTADTAILRELNSDPLNHEQLSIGIGGALMSSGHELREQAGKISQHALFLLGGEDTLCDQASTQCVIKAMPHAEQICFEKLKHSLLIERERERVYAVILRWIAA